MAFEDADLCMRAWAAGLRVVYAPASVLVHLESETRGMTQGDRELASKQRFWDRWGSAFDERDVRTADGMLKIAYVTEGTGVGGGHRVVFEHLNRLAARGHQVELYSLGGEPDWFDLAVPVHTFDDYDALARALAPVHALKVATWWRTAAPVWRASVLNGVPVYFVQDIESSYYNYNDPLFQHALASYRHEFRYLTTSNWVASELGALGVSLMPVAPGLALETYHETGAERRDDVLLSLGRAHPLKNLPLTLDGWRGMDAPRPELWLFGVEPEVALAEGARYFERPSDDEVNDLLNGATVLAQTSRHEGFCLPLLEAMAAGTPVVCTDAHGNRDFCSHGVNCLMVDARPEALTEALERLFGDAELRERLRANGRRTAERYAWELKIDELEAFFLNLAESRRARRGQRSKRRPAPWIPAWRTPGNKTRPTRAPSSTGASALWRRSAGATRSGAAQRAARGRRPRGGARGRARQRAREPGMAGDRSAEGGRFARASCRAPAQPMSARKVTVAIPVLNGAGYLDRC